jgi:aconitate hydratase
LRTVPRNFPVLSGTGGDKVFLCSPETAAAAALTGRITDPRELDMDYPRVEPPSEQVINTRMLVAPEAEPDRELRLGPNIQPLPELEPLPDRIEAPVLLALGDDVSTDEIMPAGRALSLRSNIPELARFAFAQIDEGFHDRAIVVRETSGHVVVGGDNYGQGSSREHGALVPAYLGLRAVIATAFARIHGQNLVNFGVLPLLFCDPADRDAIETGDVLRIEDLHAALPAREPIEVVDVTQERSFRVRHDLSDRQVRIVLAGGLINDFRRSRTQS